MKQLLIFILGLFFIFFSLTLLLRTNYATSLNKVLSFPTITPTPYPPQNIPQGKVYQADSDQQTYVIFIAEVLPTSKISLIANFKEKESAAELVKTYGCRLAINGGFYKENDLPLGLFVTNNKKLGELIPRSNLVNGFFWQNRDGLRFLSKQPPLTLTDVDFIFQTGPYFMIGYKLSLVSDEYARRSLLVTTEDGKLYIIIITQKNNPYSGPLLGQVTFLLSQSHLKEDMALKYALNLDGGSSSFFFSKDENQEFILAEMASVGSILCIK